MTLMSAHSPLIAELASRSMRKQIRCESSSGAAVAKRDRRRNARVAAPLASPHLRHVAPVKQRWPGDQAVLFVHGVGNAKPGSYDALVDQVKQLLGTDAASFAFYFLYYDQLNEWA